MSYIVTATGKRITPLDPNPDDICIEDIAHSLSNICRFTGHTRRFYSVAQHAFLVAQQLPPELRLCGLLHDASESFLSDLARPIKRDSAFGPAYKEAEDRLMRVIAKKFGFQWPMPREVAEADNLLLFTEARDLLAFDDWWESGPFLREEIVPWDPDFAESKFLALYNYLMEPRLVPAL